jgi:uncharacterized protein DUF6174
MRAALVLLFVLALAAPAAAQAPPQPPPNEPAESIRDGSAQRNLDRARKRWRKAGIHNYRFQLTRQCFCPPESWVLFVRGDKPRRAPAGAKDVATVRRLHRRIQAAIDDRVSGLTVKYDKRGVPRLIGIDPYELTIDEEVGYKVDKFWRGTRGRGGPDTPSAAGSQYDPGR